MYCRSKGALALACFFVYPGCSAPAAPTAPAPIPLFAVTSPDGWPITASMEGDAVRTWAEVQLCVGSLKNPPPAYPVRVRRDMIDCGGVPAWGCFSGPAIEVTGGVYATALRHEMTHLALYLAGRPYGEQAPDLLRCEQ